MLYINDYPVGDAFEIKAVTTFMTDRVSVPTTRWPTTTKLGVDGKTVAFTLVLRDWTMVENVKGIFEENGLVVLHSSWQALLDNDRTLYGIVLDFQIEEAGATYVKCSFSLEVTGTDVTAQPTYRLSSRQLENPEGLAGVTTIGLPGTAYATTTGTLQARGQGNVVVTPAWANDASYTQDEVKLGEVTYEVDFADVSKLMDAAGNHHGTKTGTVTVSEDRAHDALKFDGTSAYYTVPDHAALESPKGFSFWINPEKTGAEQAIASKRYVPATPPGRNGWCIRLKDDGTLYMMLNDSYSDTPAGFIKFGEWQQITISLDTADGGTVAVPVWRNGGEDYDGLAFMSSPSSNSIDLTVGAEAGAGFFKGLVRDFEIWSDNLTEDDAKSLYRREHVTGKFPVASYPMSAFRGSLWRNAVRVHDGSPCPQTRVRNHSHKFTRDAYLVSDLYRVKVPLSGTSVTLTTASGGTLETVTVPEIAKVWASTVTDDYSTLKIIHTNGTTSTIELWRGKDVAISGQASYTLTTSAAPGTDQTPATGTNYVTLQAGVLHVASNRSLKWTTTKEVRITDGSKDGKFWFVNVANADAAARAKEALKKLG